MLQSEFCKNPESLVVLMELATTHNDPNPRQLAAVEACSLVGKHWLGIPRMYRRRQVRILLSRSFRRSCLLPLNMSFLSFFMMTHSLSQLTQMRTKPQLMSNNDFHY